MIKWPTAPQRSAQHHDQENTNQNYNELSPHASQNGIHLKIYKQQMLARMCTAGGNVIDTTTVENSMGIPLKTKNMTTIRFSNSTTRHIPWENHNWKRRMYPNCSTSTLVAALFTGARTCMQPRCPLTDEWIKEQWYIFTMEYFSAIKINAFESVFMRWMNLESIVHSEISQKENAYPERLYW